MKTSKIPKFYKLNLSQRLGILKKFAGLDEAEIKILSAKGVLKDSMPLPLAIAANFLINGKDYLIPMAIEEPSVAAAASNAAKMARDKGGFQTNSTEPVMLGQIQLINISKPIAAKNNILKNKNKILEIANKTDPFLLKIGGGAKSLEVRTINSDSGQMVILELLVDVRDAMGANIVNTMVEAVSPFVAQITKARVCFKILSNLAIRRLAWAKAVFAQEVVGGEEVVTRIIQGYLFAKSDIYRCATHNKGIMNGIDAVLVATGQDFRAVEAGAHSFAAMTGKYLPLTQWQKDKNGDLVGTIKMPMAVGIVGGATNVNPVAKINLKILGVKTARDLAEVVVAVGLAQNFAALRALAAEGIQKGHMKLHREFLKRFNKKIDKAI